MEQITRRFTISCPEFGGYSCDVCVNDMESIQEIIDHVIGKLRKSLEELHLETLYKRLDSMKDLYHVHDYLITDILINDQEYYICKHGEFCMTSVTNETLHGP